MSLTLKAAPLPLDACVSWRLKLDRLWPVRLSRSNVLHRRQVRRFASLPIFLRVSVSPRWFFCPGDSSLPPCDRRHSAPVAFQLDWPSRRPLMSSAVMERIAEERPKLDLISSQTRAHRFKKKQDNGTRIRLSLFLWPELSRSSCLSRSSVPSWRGWRCAIPESWRPKRRLVITASAHPMPTFPVVQSAASAGFVRGPVRSWNSGMRCNVRVQPHGRSLHL